jgi:glycine cleavage system H protein
MSEASYPDGLYYNEEHDWARVDGDVATFGITWYAQDSLGEVVYFAPSAVGTTIERGGEYGELESTKAVSQLIAPLSGEVTETNGALDGSENTVNDDPYGEGWLVKVRMSDPSELDSLMDAAGYSSYVGSL